MENQTNKEKPTLAFTKVCPYGLRSVENQTYTLHHLHIGDLVGENIVSGAFESKLRLSN